MNPSELLISIMGTILTYMMWSYLYKENPLYRLAQNIFIGFWMGYYFVNGVQGIWSKGILEGIAGNYGVLLATIFGFLIVIRLFVKRVAWYARLPILVIVAVGYGVALTSMIKAEIIAQIAASILPLNNLDNIIVAIGVIIVVFYFFFSIEHKGILSYVSRTARYLLMISFGANFGFGYIARISKVIPPIKNFILPFPNVIIMPIALIIIAYDYWRTHTHKK